MQDNVRIVFIDDEINILRMLRRVLRHEPWEMEFFSDPQQAWEALQERPADIVITDHRMERLNGVELLARLKAAYPDTLRIVFSGYTEVSTLTEAINKGHIYKFIHKPIKEDDLRLTIRRAVENVWLMRENRKLAEQIKKQNDELRRLNEELEARIEQRTRDLYLRQKALETAQAILENLPAAVLGISFDGMIVYTNNAIGTLLGVPPGAILGQNYDEHLPGPLNSLVEHTMQKRHRYEWSGMLNQKPVFAQCVTFRPEEGAGGIILSVVRYPEQSPDAVNDIVVIPLPICDNKEQGKEA